LRLCPKFRGGGVFWGWAGQVVQLLPRLVLIRVEPQGFLELRKGLVTLAQRSQRLSEVDVSFRIVRLVLHRFAQVRRRLVQFPLFHEGQAKNAVGLWIVREPL